MFWRKKKITTPLTNETIEKDSIVLWYVRWERRYGCYHGDTEAVMEAFPNKDDAIEFKDSLEKAFKLIRHTSGTQVILSRN